MTKVRTGKSKGSQLEYDTQYNLERAGLTVTRTAERGYQKQFDLLAEEEGFVYAIECKRLKGISWNQAEKYFLKLREVNTAADDHYLVFQSNRQPTLIMYQDADTGFITIQKFEDYFNIIWEKHPSTRAKNAR